MYLREPIFSGYYGGANQYPIISGAMFSLINPQAIVGEGVFTGTEILAKAYSTSKTYKSFLKLGGKGMTLKIRWDKYNKFKKNAGFLLKVPDKLRNSAGIYSTYQIFDDSRKYYENEN